MLHTETTAIQINHHAFDNIHQHRLHQEALTIDSIFHSQTRTNCTNQTQNNFVMMQPFTFTFLAKKTNFTRQSGRTSKSVTQSKPGRPFTNK